MYIHAYMTHTYTHTYTHTHTHTHTHTNTHTCVCVCVCQGVALSSAHNADARVSAVAAGVLSNLALYGRQNGGKVCRILVEHGAIEALQTLIQRPERTGLSL